MICICLKATHVHLEARVNWNNNSEKTPKGAPAGGFVPYLHIIGRVINQTTGLSSFVDLLPHVNLVDNFHYARNMTLPDAITDKYTVVFTVVAPAHTELALHKDCVDAYGQALLDSQTFTYTNIDFEEIAKASRRSH